MTRERERLVAGWDWAPGNVALSVSPSKMMVDGDADVTYADAPDNDRYLVIDVEPMILRVVSISEHPGLEPDPGWEPANEFVPDLNDHGTRGHALALVRWAWGDLRMHMIREQFGDDSGFWVWLDWAGDRVYAAGRGASEAAAIAAALEAAPRRSRA